MAYVSKQAVRGLSQVLEHVDIQFFNSLNYSKIYLKTVLRCLFRFQAHMETDKY